MTCEKHGEVEAQPNSEGKCYCPACINEAFMKKMQEETIPRMKGFWDKFIQRVKAPGIFSMGTKEK